MKKSTRIILLIGICMLSVGMVLSVIGLIFGPSLQQVIDSGLWDRTLYINKDYDNHHKEDNFYEVEADVIDYLSIDWYSGEVIVEAYKGDTILMKEEIIGGGEIDEENCLRYKVGDETLKINYIRNSASVNFSEEESYRKKLTIKIPKAMAESLSDFEFDGDAANLKLNGLKIKNLTVDSQLNLTGDNLIAENVDMSTIGGNMRVQFNKCPKSLSFDSTDGQCILILPQKSSFDVEYDTVNGEFNSDFKSHEHHGETKGDGNFSVCTVNGDLVINKSGHHE